MPHTATGLDGRKSIQPGVVQRTMHRYKNLSRWRVMPSEIAVAEGYFDRGFSNKTKALAYQKLIKTLFPEELCALCDTGRYYDALGHHYDTRE